MAVVAALVSVSVLMMHIAGSRRVVRAAPPLAPLPTAGFTDLEPAKDTRKIYVSSSDGDDGNDGRSPAKAVRTIRAGIARLRNGYPDWLLLKKGDQWHEGLASWRLSGRSESEPMVIWSYGDGATRPLLETGPGDGLSAHGGGNAPPSVNHVAFVGLRFYADTRDPKGPDWKDAEGGTGVLWLLGTDDVLIEDCVFQSYTNGVVFQALGSPIRNVRLRYVQVLDSYNTKGHSEGLYTAGVDDVVVEHSLFDHNGWSDDPKVLPAAEPTVFNHNAYFHEERGKITLRDNIFMRAASHGVQLRPGGVVKDNLFVRDAIALLIGGGDHPLEGVHADVQDNVILEGTDITPQLPRGWGIDVSKNVSRARIEGNIVAHVKSHAGSGPAMVQSPNATYGRNIVYRWNGGPFNTPGPFVAANRSVEKYDALLGGPGTFEDFAARLRTQSRERWQPKLTAEAVNDYIRKGFTPRDGRSHGASNNDQGRPAERGLP